MSSSRTMQTVAILLADAERAIQLATAFEALGFRAVVALGSDDLFDITNRESISMVVIEHKLRGFLTGIEILERLHAHLLRPHTVLLAEVSPQVKDKASKLGVDRVLPADAELLQIAQATADIVLNATDDQIILSPEARSVVRQSDCIQPLPQLLVKLAGNLHSDSISAADLGRDISVDPKLTAEVLRLANSSAMGRAHRTTSITEAINFLGVRRTISLAISFGVSRVQSELLKGANRAIRSWYNYRSVMIASASSAFASTLENVADEAAFVLGLMQDLGIVVMSHAMGERYWTLLKRVQEKAQLRLSRLERAEFGTTHAEVSAALLQGWEMPNSFVRLVLHHHDAPTFQPSALEQSLVRSMQIGEAIANLADCRSAQRFHALSQHLSHYGQDRAEQCRAALTQAIASTTEYGDLFNIAVPSEEQLQEFLQNVDAQLQFDASGSPNSDYDQIESKTENLRVVGGRASSEGTVSHGRTLMVVEDEAAIVNLISLFLRPYGVQVISAFTLDEARRNVKNVDAILCDVHLKTESGIEVVASLREEGFQGVIYMISGDRQRATVQQSMMAGIDGYLLKPFSRDLLVEKLRAPLKLSAPTPDLCIQNTGTDGSWFEQPC